MPIEHDGQPHYNQEEINAMISERVKNHGAALSEAQNTATEWKTKYENASKAVATVDALTSQVSELQAKLSKAEGGLGRFRAAASIGVTDADTIDALEFAHQKAMGGVEEKDRIGFEDYLKFCKEKPDHAPSYLRGVFAGQEQKAAPKADPKSAPGTNKGTNNGQDPAKKPPPWASATAGTRPVAPGSSASFVDQVRSIDKLDDLFKLADQRKKERARR